MQIPMTKRRSSEKDSPLRGAFNPSFPHGVSHDLPASMSITDDVSTSTRVFVSGLPTNLTSKQLREHFAQKFNVTDAHVFPDRRIAFVGLTSHDAAQKAALYFNRSFVRMSKISVELAKPIEMKKGARGQAIPISKRIIDHPQAEPTASNKRKRHAHDDGEDQRVLTTSHAGNRVTTERVTNFQGSQISTDEKAAEAHEPKETVLQDEELPPVISTDSDWLRGKTSRLLDLVDSTEPVVENAERDSGQEQDGVERDNLYQADPPEQSNATSDGIEEAEALPDIPNGRLFLRNLPFSTSEEGLKTLFDPFGNVEEIHLVKDKKTQSSKGTAFIQYYNPSDAVKAFQALDGVPFQGRLLHILPASNKKDNKLTEYEISKLPLKKQKALKRKAEASSAAFSWNSLYMNPDAVLASVASRLGITKADLLDPSSADAAVKQAQAETSIIKETKEYLQSQGINIDAFGNRSRDDRSLLLKNFPFGTTSEELSTLLTEYGSVEKIIFPPTGTMAIARFDESSSCQDALKGLAYKNLKGSVLYLERAPSRIFEISKGQTPLLEDDNSATQNISAGPSATVFVRNLNFATSSNRLCEVFKALSGFMSARVKTRTDVARPGQVLSMGFGFVEFRSRAQAEAAVATMSGHRLDGHEILVQLSQKTLDAAEERRKEDGAKKANQQKTKLVVKNIPFEASKKDIKTLLGGYGTLRSLRMPRKQDHSARGFAFADFLTAKEARNAMEALSNTHLLGRRLVIDFAEGDIDDPEEMIRAMEKKAGHQLHLNAVNKMMAGSSRKKFDVEAREDEDPVA